MRTFAILSTLAVAVAFAIRLGAADAPLEPVQSIGIQQGGFVLNGKPFIPLMGWLQAPGNFAKLTACAMNSTAGYHPGAGGTKSVQEYLGLIQQAGLYGVMPYDAALKGHPALLAYIHGDEPDLPKQQSDAKVEAGKGMRLNSSTPLWKLLDGDLSSWSVLDPMEGAEVTLKLKAPVTVTSLAVHQTTSPNLAMAKDVVFYGDGAELLKATLENKRGRQKFDLPGAATFSELRLKVVTATVTKQAWGSISEVEAFDKDGKNLLLSPARWVPRRLPPETLKEYQAIKAADPSRPVFMTLTAYFHPIFKKGDDAALKALYPQYVAATDVVGYDVYPIYGWNKPEWIHLGHECTARLKEMAGEKPVYAWIETCKGGQFTGDFAKQKDVTPTHIRAEVWMALCRGATAIGYFTHVWKPAFSEFGVPEENRAAIRSINQQITRLTPALRGEPTKRKVTIEGEGGVKLDVLAKESGGELYLFAVNYDERAKQTRATVRVEGLKAGAVVSVVDEERTVTVAPGMDGAFSDAFAPLAVHIYRVK